MDVLADVFSSTRVGEAIYGRARLSGRWGMRFDRQDKAGFHLVLEGRCFLRLKGRGPALELGAGDVVVLPRGWMHVVTSAPNAQALPYRETLALHADRPARGPETLLLCGAFAFDTPEPHPLLAALPQVIHVPAGGHGTPGRLKSVMEILGGELAEGAAGADVVAKRLLDVVLVLAVRDWFNTAREALPDGMGALRDGPTSRALAAIHAHPRHPWTVESLAQHVGVSRATLARRFQRLLGEAPLAYVRRWRLTLAALELRRTDASVGELAELAGYESEAAFHRAFTRARGMTPAEYRRRERDRVIPPSLKPAAASGAT
jgi:AraC-like DNA-binding protein